MPSSSWRRQTAAKNLAVRGLTGAKRQPSEEWFICNIRHNWIQELETATLISVLFQIYVTKSWIYSHRLTNNQHKPLRGESNNILFYPVIWIAALLKDISDTLLKFLFTLGEWNHVCLTLMWILMIFNAEFDKGLSSMIGVRRSYLILFMKESYLLFCYSCSIISEMWIC